MAEFVPFGGLRFNPEKVNLSEVLCPPYDVIKGKMRDDLIARNAHNIVQVELATHYGTDATSEQYARSAQTLRDWQEEGVLVRDDPAFYLYEQEFQVPNSSRVKKRRGVLGALCLEPFGEGVQPHEHTLSGPKADRLNLLRATRTNTSPIFGLYTDSQGWIESLLNDVAFDKPVSAATDSDGIIHRLWKVQDDETVNAIVAALENESLLIADGHHRYETALNFQRESQEKAEANGQNWTGDEDENFVLMMCVSTEDDGLIVLPTHRVANVDTPDLLDKLGTHFEVSETASLDELQNALDNANFASQPGRFGLVRDGKYFLLQLKAGDAHQTSMDSSKSEAYRDLDVSLLHTLILEHLLGIDAEKLAAGGHIAYTIDAQEAQDKAQSQNGTAWLMRPTPVKQVQDVAKAGDKMPQKSTYFYPKLITGLVLRPID